MRRFTSAATFLQVLFILIIIAGIHSCFFYMDKPEIHEPRTFSFCKTPYFLPDGSEGCKEHGYVTVQE